jgi:hypothetical protein
MNASLVLTGNYTSILSKLMRKILFMFTIEFLRKLKINVMFFSLLKQTPEISPSGFDI